MSLTEARRLLERVNGVAELRLALDQAERDQLFVAGVCQRHRTGEFKQVTEAVLAYHNERVRLARIAWLAAMNGEYINAVP